MKRWIRSALELVLACAVLSTATSAWADKPENYERGPFHFGPMPFFDCTQFDGMDYWLWAKGAEMDVGKIFFDKEGTWKQTVGKMSVVDASIWAPVDPGCNDAPFLACIDPWAPMVGTNVFTLDDGRGTAEHRTAIYRDWFLVDPDAIPDNGDEFWWPTWGQEMGIFFKLVLPGYGAIFHNAGLITIQLNFETGDWDVIKVTPNQEGFDVDQVHAICSYIGNR